MSKIAYFCGMKKDKEPKVTIAKDGPILWLSYNVFNALRQVSLFQQVRNVARWCGRTSFTSGYLFPELWVIGHLILGSLACWIVSAGCATWLGWVFCIYAMLRSFEIFVYQFNVLLFDPIRSGRAKYKIKSSTRMVLLLICNIFEYVIWFGVIYLFARSQHNLPPSGQFIFFESFQVLANITEPSEFPDSLTVTIANIESLIGLFMNIVCLARFISMLPPVETVEDN